MTDSTRSFVSRSTRIFRAFPKYLKRFLDALMARRYTKEQLMTRLRVFIGVALTLTFIGMVTAIMFMMVSHTTTTVVDQKYLDILNPIIIFLTGMLSGLMVNSRHEPAEEIEDDKAGNSRIKGDSANPDGA